VTSSPIPRVLSTLLRARVKALLMGGQACILYGAAEFSRDVEIAVAVSPANLRRLLAALAQLEAEPLLFPPLSPQALRRGHACHFRSRARGLHGVRLAVMGVFRGAPPSMACGHDAGASGCPASARYPSCRCPTW
jgi:hypothetical protein